MNTKGRQLVVLAGGEGSRMTKVGITSPKILFSFHGTPLIERIISEAIEEDFTQILWCLGHGHEQIEKYFREHPNLSDSIENTLFVEKQRSGTLGALIQARSQLDDDFCVIMGDLMLSRTNIGGLFQNFKNMCADALVLVKYTNHPEDSDLVILSKDLRVEALQSYPHESIPKIPIGNAGAIYLQKKHVPEKIVSPKRDLFKHLVPDLISQKLYVSAVFHQGEIRDVGTPERFEDALSSPKLLGNLNQSTGIFFDRDGTLNIQNGHIKSKSEIQLYPETGDLLKLASKGFDIIGIITNQPVIARGEVTMSEVEKINAFLLERAGIGNEKEFVLKVCPHHPDEGFIGEVSELKVHCICRKPASGLFLEALNENGLRSNNTLYVGDSITDLQAAQAAGIQWIHILNESGSRCTSHSRLTQGLCLDRPQLLSFLDSRGGVLC
jgi:histidinol-phosphate phosphatase family protein